MTSTELRQTPLETLVIAQLAAIREQEASLQTRIDSGASLDTAAKMASEISKLRMSADRLNRMIDAMSLTGWCALASQATA